MAALDSLLHRPALFTKTEERARPRWADNWHWLIIIVLYKDKE